MPRRSSSRSGPPPLRFEDVRFRDLVLDAAIAPGETAVVGGPAGSGKSSLLALAAGLETPEAGRVDFGARDKRPMTVYVGSRSPILQGSLRRALTLGISPRPDDAAVEARARNFGLGPLIERLGGLDARVGEGGRTLSDGETLRVHLARAELSAPDLLVVDAPGVGSDPELRRSFASLVRNGAATTLVAASEAAPWDIADRRLVMAKGRIIEPSAEAPAFEEQPAE